MEIFLSRSKLDSINWYNFIRKCANIDGIFLTFLQTLKQYMHEHTWCVNAISQCIAIAKEIYNNTVQLCVRFLILIFPFRFVLCQFISSMVSFRDAASCESFFVSIPDCISALNHTDRFSISLSVLSFFSYSLLFSISRICSWQMHCRLLTRFHRFETLLGRLVANCAPQNSIYCVYSHCILFQFTICGYLHEFTRIVSVSVCLCVWWHII